MSQHWRDCHEISWILWWFDFSSSTTITLTFVVQVKCLKNYWMVGHGFWYKYSCLPSAWNNFSSSAIISYAMELCLSWRVLCAERIFDKQHQYVMLIRCRSCWSVMFWMLVWLNAVLVKLLLVVWWVSLSVSPPKSKINCWMYFSAV